MRFRYTHSLSTARPTVSRSIAVHASCTVAAAHRAAGDDDRLIEAVRVLYAEAQALGDEIMWSSPPPPASRPANRRSLSLPPRSLSP
ncbi:hypothetical protein DSL92_08440 [Billgrantia gudaonensis]|uniref:Uncharacterized protein n=1 Tax=Billgrantia gudaonensis TaxID=376427 RepID=A0A3S0R4J5_9GAMM|nr:hypothetical protein DSL92_08440 [Halomonas gudaonensis]